ncbi:TMAO reductase system periplasmic protein TorT [Neptuniibacter sp. QD48_11]|uniref:TMAO reductase system periplasmic protein TorT n=1 Tax=unclassified Neptuniibacter TaxID=2630693 RepID=UPI0039F57A63
MLSYMKLLIFIFTSFFFASNLLAADSPLNVQSYYSLETNFLTTTPQFKRESWETVTPAKPYHIAVLIPHLNDPYWITASYGLISHAKELGIQLSLYSFGGYGNFGDQRHKLVQLSKEVDGIILATVDNVKMDQTLQQLDLPVIGLINEIKSSAIKAKAMVSYQDAGYAAGKYVVEDSIGKDINIAFFPGPKRSGWADDMYEGFLAAISELKPVNQTITIFPPLYGDTRHKVQRLRVSTLIKAKGLAQIDYIVGNAVAAKEAAKILSDLGESSSAEVVSTYITRDIYDDIKNGNVKAAPHDQTLVICQLAIDMMVKTLNGQKPGVDFPYHAKPDFLMITNSNINEYSFYKLFGPAYFEPEVTEFRTR